jgi:hypothetical protein
MQSNWHYHHRGCLRFQSVSTVSNTKRARQDWKGRNRTYLDIVDLEWLRVSQRCSQCSVLGTGRAHQELKFVKSKLDPGLKLVLWCYGSTEVETVPNSKDRFELKIFAPVKVLDQTKTVGVLVAPSAGSTRPVLQRTNGLIPLPEVWWVVTFEVVS